MQLQHQINTFHGCLAIGIEEKDPCIVNQYIHHVAIRDTPIMQLFGGVGQTKVGITRYRLYAISGGEIRGYVRQLFFLIAD